MVMLTFKTTGDWYIGSLRLTLTMPGILDKIDRYSYLENNSPALEASLALVHRSYEAHPDPPGIVGR